MRSTRCRLCNGLGFESRFVHQGWFGFLYGSPLIFTRTSRVDLSARLRTFVPWVACGIIWEKAFGLGAKCGSSNADSVASCAPWSLMWKYTSTLRSQNPPDLCFMLRRSCASRSRTGDERDSLFAAGAFIRPCARAGPFGAAARLAGAFTREARRVRRQQRHR